MPTVTAKISARSEVGLPGALSEPSRGIHRASHDPILIASRRAHSGRCESANPERYWLRSPPKVSAMAAAEPVSIDSSDMPPVQPV